MSNYFESYSFEVPTDSNSGKTKYSFTGPKEYIDKIRAKPVQITNSYTVNGWAVQQFGFDDGTLKNKAEKMQGVKTIKIETVTPNRLAKFIKIEIEGDYNPYMPLADTVSYVEVSDRQNRTNAEFTKIDSESEQPYQRRFSNSSILSIAEFLHDKEFESMLKSVKEVE
jgi:hypothetical protein